MNGPWTIPDRVVEVAAANAATVLIDGRSGSGKSMLADELARRFVSTVVVHLDDIYPGWDGLAWTIDHVHTALLQPRAAGRMAHWQRWDWTTNAPAGWVSVHPDQRLIVEGVGALTVANRALADLGVWVDASDELRKQRALDRDGDMYRPHWDDWAAQEDAFIARHAPQAAADYVIAAAAPGWQWTHPDEPGMRDLL